MTDQEKIIDPDSEHEESQSLEEMFAQLEQLISGMEDEEASLEDTFEMYHRGMDMLKSCSEKIDRIEKKMLVLDEKGETHEF